MYRRRACQALPGFEICAQGRKAEEQVKNHGRACTQVFFPGKAELGFFHFLEIVIGWLVPWTKEDPSTARLVPSTAEDPAF